MGRKNKRYLMVACGLVLLASFAGNGSHAQSDSEGASVQDGVRDKGRLVPKQEQSGEQRITDQAYRPRAARRLVQKQRLEEDKVEDAETADRTGRGDAADEEKSEPSPGRGNKERRLLFGF